MHLRHTRRRRPLRVHLHHLAVLFPPSLETRVRPTCLPVPFTCGRRRVPAQAFVDTCVAAKLVLNLADSDLEAELELAALTS